MSTTVRVSRETHERLTQLSNATGMQIQRVVEAAVVAYEAEVFWSEFDRGYAALGDDPDAWAGVQAERAGEAAALADDLAEPSAER